MWGEGGSGWNQFLALKENQGPLRLNPLGVLRPVEDRTCSTPTTEERTRSEMSPFESGVEGLEGDRRIGWGRVPVPSLRSHRVPPTNRPCVDRLDVWRRRNSRREGRLQIKFSEEGSQPKMRGRMNWGESSGCPDRPDLKSLERPKSRSFAHTFTLVPDWVVEVGVPGKGSRVRICSQSGTHPVSTLRNCPLARRTERTSQTPVFMTKVKTKIVDLNPIFRRRTGVPRSGVVDLYGQIKGVLRLNRRGVWVGGR